MNGDTVLQRFKIFPSQTGKKLVARILLERKSLVGFEYADITRRIVDPRGILRRVFRS